MRLGLGMRISQTPGIVVLTQVVLTVLKRTGYGTVLPRRLRYRQVLTSDGVKDTDGKAKAKDISHEAKTKAKDMTLKAKDTRPRPRTYSIP